jgi:MFS family permease
MKSDIIPSLHRGLIDDRSVVQTGVKSNSLEVMYSVTYFTLAIYSGTIYFLVSPVYQYMNGHMDSPYAIPILGTYIWFTWWGKAYFGYLTDTHVICGRRATPYLVILMLTLVSITLFCVFFYVDNLWVLVGLSLAVMLCFSFLDALAQGLTTVKLQLECDEIVLEGREQKEKYGRSCSKHFGVYSITRFASRLACLGFGAYAANNYTFNACLIIFSISTLVVLLMILICFKELKRVPKEKSEIKGFWAQICSQLSSICSDVLAQKTVIGVTLALCNPNLAIETYILAKNNEERENILPLYSSMALGLAVCLLPLIILPRRETVFRKVSLTVFSSCLLLTQASVLALTHFTLTPVAHSLWLDLYLLLSNLTNCAALLPLVSACSALIPLGQEGLSINLISTFYNVAVLLSRSILLIEDNYTQSSFKQLEFNELVTTIDINAFFSLAIVGYLIFIPK